MEEILAPQTLGEYALQNTSEKKIKSAIGYEGKLEQ